jgi:hypothetical protein
VKPGKQAARLAFALPLAEATTGPPPSRAAELLAALASALNALEEAGLPVKLAHGAALTDAGFVFRLAQRGEQGPDGETWQPRTRMLAEFPVPDGDDFDD